MSDGWRRNLSKLRRVSYEEFGEFQLRIRLACLVGRLVPHQAGGRLRAQLLRIAGVDMGRGVAFAGMPTIIGKRGFAQLLHIGDGCWFNVGCTLDVHAELRLGQNVRLGHEAMILTMTHRLGPASEASDLDRVTFTGRAGPMDARPVIIGDNVWVGARATVMPGVTIGRDAVVAAGAVVIRDVAPNTAVGGVPARVLRELPLNHQAE